MPAGRVSARQSIVVLPVTTAEFAGAPLAQGLDPIDHAALLSTALLDVLGALVRVDGVNIAVTAPPDPADQTLLAGLPAGIEVIGPGTATGTAARPASILTAALDALLDRGFGRVVAVASDVVGLTPRTAATALSSLGDADLAVGQSPGGAGYLVGVRDRQGFEALRSVAVGSGLGGPAFVDRVGHLGLVARRIEPRARLVELNGVPALAAVVERDLAQAPRLAQFLRQRQMLADRSADAAGEEL